MSTRSVMDVLESLDDEVERALSANRSPKGGMSVPFLGDFAHVRTSALKRIQWWSREIKAAYAREQTTKGEQPAKE